MEWQPIETRPTGEYETYLVKNGKGQVAPIVCDIIQNNPGTIWDWDFGERATAWMPLPPAELGEAPTEGEFLAERPNGDWLKVRNQPNFFDPSIRSVIHAESGKFWNLGRWMPLPPPPTGDGS